MSAFDILAARARTASNVYSAHVRRVSESIPESERTDSAVKRALSADQDAREAYCAMLDALNLRDIAREIQDISRIDPSTVVAAEQIKMHTTRVWRRARRFKRA